jgi:hypothetical protein
LKFLFSLSLSFAISVCLLFVLSSVTLANDDIIYLNTRIINGGTHKEEICGAHVKDSAIANDTSLTITGGTFKKNIYAGYVVGNARVDGSVLKISRDPALKDATIGDSRLIIDNTKEDSNRWNNRLSIL